MYSHPSRLTFTRVLLALGGCGAAALILLVMAAAVASLPAAAQSFACGGQLNAAERAICSSATFRNMDSSIASKYYATLSRVDRSERAQVRQAQRRFLARRNRCGEREGCLREAYETQFDVLDGF